jgi:hypothetical protein
MNSSRLPLSDRILVITFFILGAAQGQGQAHSITYRWLNQPCAELINCAIGCTACNVPEDDTIVFGSNAAFIGVDACPHPTQVGDNALWLTGWCAAPDSTRRILISGIAQVPVRIDSVIIVHRSEVDGPTRVVFSIKDLADGGGEIKDVPTSSAYEHTTLTNGGDVAVPAGAAYGTFQLQLQAYGGNGGAWVLEEVRIVTTPADGLVTGITSIDPTMTLPTANTVDLLGRDAGPVRMDGMAFRAGRTVIVP